MNSGEFYEKSHGHYGHDVFADTAAHNGKWGSFTALTDSVITATAAANSTSLAGRTVPAGTTIFGHFTSIQLASGSIVAYKEPGLPV